MTDEDRALLAQSSAAFDTVGALIEQHRQKSALNDAMSLVGDINKYISATEPWKIKDDPERLGTVLHVAAQAVSDANHLLAPFLPHSSQKVWEALGGEGTFSPLPHIEEVNDLDDPEFTYPVITGKYVLGENVHPWKSEPIVVGAPVVKPTPIFAKIPRRRGRGARPVRRRPQGTSRGRTGAPGRREGQARCRRGVTRLIRIQSA